MMGNIDELPIHYAGTVGNNGQILTVIDVDRKGGKIVGIKCSGAMASDCDAVKEFDKAQFLSDIPGIPNIKPIVIGWGGLVVIDKPVYFTVARDNGSDASGHLWIYPQEWQYFEKGETVTEDIVPGMQIKIMPDHRVGLMMADKGGE